MTLAHIVSRLGGDLYAGGRRASVPAPGHSRHDRSVSLLLEGERLVIHTFNGVDWREVRDEFRRLGLIDAAGVPYGGAKAPGAPLAPRPDAARRIGTAQALWDEARAIEASLAERHARRRGVTRVLGPALRFHPQAPLAVYARGRATRPALLAAILDPDGVLSGVEITYLSPGGARALDLRVSRKIVGVVPSGAAVRLDPAGEALLVGEGVFTVLSASERFSRPGWALLSVGNLAAWSPPPGVVDVLIAADSGRVGEEAARRLARRIAALGPHVSVLAPPPPFDDWNAVAAHQIGRRLARRGGGKGGTGAGA